MFRYRNFLYSTSSSLTNSTMVQENSIPEENSSFFLCNGAVNLTNIQIPIVGYEIMEERARFTVKFFLIIIFLIIIILIHLGL